MLLIQVPMIFAMAGAPAALVPAPMVSPMIAILIAMILAMLPPAWIGRMQLAMVPIGVAMISPVASRRTLVSVVRRSYGGLMVDLLHLALGALSALHRDSLVGTEDPVALDALRSQQTLVAPAFDLLGACAAITVTTTDLVLILSGSKRRQCHRRQQDEKY